MVRCNATEILAIAYPLEKRGEGREVASKFLIKQQDAFKDLLEDRCPQVRIAAIKVCKHKFLYILIFNYNILVICNHQQLIILSFNFNVYREFVAACDIFGIHLRLII